LSFTFKPWRHSTHGGFLSLNAAIYSNNIDIDRTKPLLDAFLQWESDAVISNAVYAAITESTPLPCLRAEGRAGTDVS